MNGADAIVEILQREGIRQVFCYPLTNLLDALARAGVRILSARQERVAGNMADGVSRSTNGRQIGVFTVQSRAGAENAFAGVAHSFTDSTPVLFLPGHAGLDQIGTHPSFDCVDNYRATTKMANKVISPELAPSRLRHAFTALRSGRPRPGDAGGAGRRLQGGIQGRPGIHPYTPHAGGGRSGRRGRGRRTPAPGRTSHDLGRPGHPLRRGEPRTGGGGRDSGHSGHDHPSGKERLPRTPRALGRSRRLLRHPSWRGIAWPTPT